MTRFDAIAAELRRQRRDIDDLLEDTSVRCEETAGLLKKIEELRRRAEDTRLRTLVPPKTAE
jgi:phosphohistidine phosphatase SixA